MKALTFALLLFAGLVFNSCKKDNSNANDSALTGKWKLTEMLASPGNGTGKWTSVPQKADYDYVTFRSTGKVDGTVFSGYVSYALKNTDTIVLATGDKIIQNYRYSIVNDTLSMSPAGPIRCYEGCGIKFTKIR